MRLFSQTFTSLAIATTAALNLSTSAKAITLTIGQNFTASIFLEDSERNPPDTMGAVGEEHIVELINGRYSVYRKSDGVRVQTSSLNDFWTEAGVTPAGGFAFDPRVLYDPFSQRWFATAVDNFGGDNNFLLAASNFPDPTAGWTGFAIDSDSLDQRWADFPTLGFDRDGVYLSASMFPIFDFDDSSVRTTIVALPKNDLLTTTPTVANATLFESLPLDTTGFTVQPIVDLDNTGLPIPLLSAFDTIAGLFNRLSIAGDINSPILETSDTLIAVTPFSPPFGAVQPGTGAFVDTGDNRFSSNLILQNGSIWGVQTVGIDRSALRWFQIDADTNTLLQEGLIRDSKLDFYYGSIAVNEFNDVVIGFSASGESQFISSYAVLGQTTSGVTTFGKPTLLKAGIDNYFGGRWGDYSATVLDPTDPLSFWTFQEWALGEETWATQITQLRVIRDVASVPEPTSALAILPLGVFGITAVLKRQQQQKS
jgi:hypothetical protein